MSAIFDPDCFFDKIFCVSVDSRTDRQTTAKKQFEKLGILDRVDFFLVKKHPDNPEEGIFLSHLQCINLGLEAGAKHILIFEDDILIKNFQPQDVVQAEQFLRKKQHWDGFFLGAITSGSEKTESKSVAKIRYRCLTHGYALNRPFAQKIVKESWSGMAYDGVLRKLCTDSYALSPMIAFQNTSMSDNKTFFLDKIRRFFGGLEFLQRSNEMYQRHKRPIIFAHCIVLMVVLLLVIQK